jgi:aspartokinase-like uncharacterized kinase
VIKLGGSLLGVDDLAPRLGRWLAAQAARANVMVVGGGSFADAIREAYRKHDLSEEAAHWLCVRILGVTAELVHRLLPESVLVRSFEELREVENQGRLTLFETERFLREEEPVLSPVPLPHCWGVTSDSIAARLAMLLGADELVLLKSSVPAEGTTFGGAAETEYVDGYFARAAAGLSAVRCVNLRDDEFAETTLRA